MKESNNKVSIVPLTTPKKSKSFKSQDYQSLKKCVCPGLESNQHILANGRF